MFKQAATYNNRTDIEEYTDTVTSYITKCIDDVTHTKDIITRANWKPWLTGDVLRLLRARDKAYRAGDEAGMKTARANLWHQGSGIKEAKKEYTHKITTHFKDSRNAQSLWQSIQALTDYKPAPQSCESNIPLLNNLNRFFARFEAQNSTCPQKTHPPLHEQPLCLSADSVKRTLAAINTRKATGPDNIPAATIIPVPKKTAPSCFNDYRPVALTPIIMKCFERLVMSHIKAILPPTLDPFQFAYRAKRSTEDAICSALHPALTHLEKKRLICHTQHLPLTIDGAVVERASSTKFLGVHISEDLSWTTNTASLAKRAQRRLYFLRKLRRASAPPAIMTTFYRCTIESILSSCIAVWGGSCTEYNRKALQRIVNTAGRIIGASLPSLKDIYTTHLTPKGDQNSVETNNRYTHLRSVCFWRTTMATASKHKSKSIKFTLVSISREVQIHPGDDITLPCHLSPEASAVAMEIRWFKGTDCIYLYRKPFVHVQTSFKGRLATKTLKKGDVSLTMKKSTWGDAGQYTCQVIHGEEKEEQTVALQFDDQGETGVICPDLRKITDRHEKQMEESVRAIEEVSRQLREERKKHEGQLIQETQKAYKLAYGAKLNKKMAKALAYQRAEGRGKWPNSKEMLRCDYEEGRRREAERKSTNSKQQEEVGETQRENRQDNVTSLLRQVLSLETELQMRNSEVQELRTQLQGKERGDRHNQVERHKQRERREHLNVGGESPGPAPPVSPAASELRLVLLGGSTAGKRAAGNTILGTNTLTETQHSKSRQGGVAGRRVTTVETPDWFCSGLSEKDMRKDVGLCVRLSAPGPHAFLLVIPVEPSEGEERRMLEKMEDIFGEGCWGHTLILFTHAEGLRERSVEELLQTGSQELQQLVEKCGNRCHLLNVKDRPDDTKITQLLEKIEEMLWTENYAIVFGREIRRHHTYTTPTALR
ncbi:hypothetical protein AALO_G00035910 [Alosa alosa]|uniref:GTPase IMAP family member 8-like n=1 Tax=Alosa alosa TaxID=278164 RepID=A0AAV6HBQ7_9TELE|nr:hypothetical protein AALO_G00035910 [Alosa alosa]